MVNYYHFYGHIQSYKPVLVVQITAATLKAGSNTVEHEGSPGLVESSRRAANTTFRPKHPSASSIKFLSVIIGKGDRDLPCIESLTYKGGLDQVPSP